MRDKGERLMRYMGGLGGHIYIYAHNGKKARPLSKSNSEHRKTKSGQRGANCKCMNNNNPEQKGHVSKATSQSSYTSNSILIPPPTPIPHLTHPNPTWMEGWGAAVAHVGLGMVG